MYKHFILQIIYSLLWDTCNCIFPLTLSSQRYDMIIWHHSIWPVHELLAKVIHSYLGYFMQQSILLSSDVYKMCLFINLKQRCFAPWGEEYLQLLNNDGWTSGKLRLIVSFQMYFCIVLYTYVCQFV